MDDDPVVLLSPEREMLRARLGIAVDGLRTAWSRHQVGLIVVTVEGSGPIERSGGVDARGVGPAVLDDRIRTAVRPGDAVARLDESRVAVLCERLDGIDDAVVIALRIEDALARIIPGRDGDRSAGEPTGGGSGAAAVDIALTLVGSDLTDVDGLVDGAADRSLPGRWVEFDDVLRLKARVRERLESDLRAASGGDGLVLHYQPERDLTSGRIAAVEALLRWERDGVLIGPDVFIPLAEETGLIVPIGAWVLGEACAQLASWRRAGVAQDVSMAVNVSPPQLLQPGFVELVGSVVVQHGLGPGDLVLEITENVLLVDVDSAVRCIDALRLLGVRIAIDDFGTGHASLTYLHRLPIDAVKLDRSFVSGLGVDERLTSIVTAVVGLIHAIGVEPIAEGVSTAEQYELLRALGCRLAQGSYIGEPGPGPDLLDVLT